MLSPSRLKRRIAKAAFRAGRVNRIHIVGCARSGTTFLQYCMLAYQDTHVVNAETSPLYPPFPAKLALGLKSLTTGGCNYVTKRGYGWFNPGSIDDLEEAVRSYDTGVVQIIRDPRAVLRSMHRRSNRPDHPYVEEDRWYQSIVAGELLWDRFVDVSRKCLIRYEDLINDCSLVDNALSTTFGLKKVEGVGAINQAKTNAQLIGYAVSGEQEAAMHGLRDADPAAAKTAPDDVQIKSERIRAKYDAFIARYYPDS